MFDIVRGGTARAQFACWEDQEGGTRSNLTGCIVFIRRKSPYTPEPALALTDAAQGKIIATWTAAQTEGMAEGAVHWIEVAVDYDANDRQIIRLDMRAL